MDNNAHKPTDDQDLGNRLFDTLLSELDSLYPELGLKSANETEVMALISGITPVNGASEPTIAVTIIERLNPEKITMSALLEESGLNAEYQDNAVQQLLEAYTNKSPAPAPKASALMQLNAAPTPEPKSAEPAQKPIHTHKKFIEPGQPPISEISLESEEKPSLWSSFKNMFHSKKNDDFSLNLEDAEKPNTPVKEIPGDEKSDSHTAKAKGPETPEVPLENQPLNDEREDNIEDEISPEPEKKTGLFAWVRNHVKNWFGSEEKDVPLLNLTDEETIEPPGPNDSSLDSEGAEESAPADSTTTNHSMPAESTDIEANHAPKSIILSTAAIGAEIATAAAMLKEKYNIDPLDIEHIGVLREIQSDVSDEQIDRDVLMHIKTHDGEIRTVKFSGKETDLTETEEQLNTMAGSLNALKQQIDHIKTNLGIEVVELKLDDAAVNAEKPENGKTPTNNKSPQMLAETGNYVFGETFLENQDILEAHAGADGNLILTTLVFNKQTKSSDIVTEQSVNIQDNKLGLSAEEIASDLNELKKRRDGVRTRPRQNSANITSAHYAEAANDTEKSDASVDSTAENQAPANAPTNENTNGDNSIKDSSFFAGSFLAAANENNKRKQEYSYHSSEDADIRLQSIKGVTPINGDEVINSKSKLVIEMENGKVFNIYVGPNAVKHAFKNTKDLALAINMAKQDPASIEEEIRQEEAGMWEKYYKNERYVVSVG